MRTVVRNSFARQTIRAERVTVASANSCAECGDRRIGRTRRRADGTAHVTEWLYRFHVDDDQGSRHSGPIAGGKLFCSRGCCEAYTGQDFAE